jgi:hypothetical protein
MDLPDVPRVGVVDGCTHCYSQADLALLGGDPALVPDDLVGAFAREALDHWDADQYVLLWRGLAPRILGLLATSPDSMLLHGLVPARFTTWPAAEQTAVLDTLRSTLSRALSQPPGVLAELIYAAAHATHDLTPWLAFLDTLTGPEADAAIAGLARYLAGDIARGSEPTLWWWPPDPMAPIRTWLYSDALHECLSRIGDMDTQIAIAQM